MATAVALDLDTDGQVVWTWDPELRMLSVSEGGKSSLGPNIVCMKYEHKTVSTTHVLGANVDDVHPLAVLLASQLLVEKSEEVPHELGLKKEILVSISLPSFHLKNKTAAARKIKESIRQHLLTNK